MRAALNILAEQPVDTAVASAKTTHMGKENGADFKILQSNYHNFTNYDHSFKQYHMISYPVNLDSAIETKQSLLQAGRIKIHKEISLFYNMCIDPHNMNVNWTRCELRKVK